MTKPHVKTIGAWAKATGIHWVLVGFSLFFITMPLFLKSIGLMPGEAYDLIGWVILIFHATAAGVGVLFPRASIRSCLIVSSIALIPACHRGFGIVYETLQHRYYLPYTRFKRCVASPVPKSVTNLRFVSYEEALGSGTFLRFDIDPTELNRLLRSLNMKAVAAQGLLNPDDNFQYAFYLPIQGDYHLYQVLTESTEDATPLILTAKLNASHSHAVFRIERSRSNGKWDWEIEVDELSLPMKRDGLERLKKKFEQHK